MATGAVLLGWGTASALSGPEPVPDSYGGRFVLTYAGQNTEVFNVSGCDLAPTGSGRAVVKPCRFEVPANAAPYLKQKIVGALGSGSPPPSTSYTLTHYEPNPTDPSQAVSDYAVSGHFTISHVTLPVLQPLDSASARGGLGVELTPLSGPLGGPDVSAVPGNPLPSLPTPRQFEVGTPIACGVRLFPPALDLSGFTTAPLRSLAVSVDTSGPPALKTGPVRIVKNDDAEVATARDWLAISPPPGQSPSASQLKSLRLTMATYDCATGTVANQLTMSLHVVATSMDPFARTDGYFTLGLASAGMFTTSWR